MKATNSHLDGLLAGLTFQIGTITPEGEIVGITDRVISKASRPVNQIIGRYLWDSPWFSHDRMVAILIQEAVHIAAKGQARRLDCTMHFGKEHTVKVDLSITPIFSDSNTVRSLTISAVDIKIRNALLLTQERHEVTLESIEDCVIYVSKEGLIEMINPAANTLLHAKTGSAIGQPIQSYFQLRQANTNTFIQDPVARCIRERRIVTMPHGATLHVKNVTSIPIAGSVSPIWLPSDALAGVVISFRDISKEKEFAEALHESRHDALTGLVNRREFYRRIKSLIQATKIDHSESIVCFIDIDNFKQINDSCGHGVGDRVLNEIVSLIRARIRKGDILARIGGDEFGLILRDCSLSEGLKNAEKIVEAGTEYGFIWRGQRISTGFSLGAVSLTSDSSDPDELLRAADHACYVAKKNGKGRCNFNSDYATDFSTTINFYN